jgi:anti-sigma-K factor RskA
MRDCPLVIGKSAELIVGYGARTLTPDEEAAFESHMLTCQDCRELAAVQRELWSALDEWTPVAVSPNFDEKLFERIRAEERGAWRGLWLGNWSWRPAMPVAAACAILVAAFLVKSPAPTAAPQAIQPQVQIQQVEQALDDIEMLTTLGVEGQLEKPGASEKI